MKTSPTLAADAILTHPEAAAIVEELRALLPTWFLDQADAANDHIFTNLDRIGRLDRPDLHLIGMTPAGTPDWLRLGALDALTAFCMGTASTCLHSPSPTRPMPIAAAAWKPGVITCGHCTHLLKTTAAIDKTCDACGHVCAGVEAGDPIYPGVIKVGLVVYSFGTCTDCRLPESAA